MNFLDGQLTWAYDLIFNFIVIIFTFINLNFYIMKKLYLKTSISIGVFFIILFLSALNALSQRYVNVSPGVGTLNDSIFSDTTDTGARIDSATIYVLERDGIYLVTGSIEHRFPLTIQAAEGEGARPKVYPAVDDGNESSRLFTPRDDLTVKSLDISNTDELGARNKNTFRIKGDDATVIVEDCLITEDSQAPFRCDGDHVSIIISNSIISNMDQDYDNGRVVDDRGNPIKSLWLENNTFYNIGSRVLRDGGSYIEWAIINHNTISNTGRRAFDLGEVVVAEVKNNIFLDCGILGDDTTTTAALIKIDSLTSGDVAGQTQIITISNNNFFLAQGYIDNFPDSAAVIPIFNPTAQAYIDETGTGSTMLYEDLEFTNGPAKNYEATTKYWDNPDATVTLPEFDRANEPFDFGYLNSLVYVGADNGSQMGDQRWIAGPTVGIQNQAVDNVFGLKSYPNPFSTQTSIEFELTAKGHVSIEVYNIAGARMASLVNQVKTSGKHIVNWNGTSGNGSLPNGIYFLKMRVGNQFSTTKILIQK